MGCSARFVWVTGRLTAFGFRSAQSVRSREFVTQINLIHRARHPRICSFAPASPLRAHRPRWTTRLIKRLSSLSYERHWLPSRRCRSPPSLARKTSSRASLGQQREPAAFVEGDKLASHSTARVISHRGITRQGAEAGTGEGRSLGGSAGSGTRRAGRRR